MGTVPKWRSLGLFTSKARWLVFVPVAKYCIHQSCCSCFYRDSLFIFPYTFVLITLFYNKEAPFLYGMGAFMHVSSSFIINYTLSPLLHPQRPLPQQGQSVHRTETGECGRHASLHQQCSQLLLRLPASSSW